MRYAQTVATHSHLWANSDLLYRIGQSIATDPLLVKKVSHRFLVICTEVSAQVGVRLAVSTERSFFGTPDEMDYSGPFWKGYRRGELGKATQMSRGGAER